MGQMKITEDQFALLRRISDTADDLRTKAASVAKQASEITESTLKGYRSWGVSANTINEMQALDAKLSLLLDLSNEAFDNPEAAELITKAVSLSRSEAWTTFRPMVEEV